MSERVSFEELLEICNKVRAAGGGELIEALIPAVPGSANSCLIAKNLNFGCSVMGLRGSVDCGAYGYPEDEQPWGMVVEDYQLRDKISQALGWPILKKSGPFAHIAIIIPPEVAQMAREFDEWWTTQRELLPSGINEDLTRPLTDEEVALIREFSPYVVKEWKNVRAIFNEEGEMII